MSDTPIFDNVGKNEPETVFIEKRIIVPVDNTPNVVITNPRARVALRTILDTIGGLAFIAVAVDVSSPAFDIASITGPVLAGYAAARVVFGFAVDTPNSPTLAKTDV